ncbi:hypothetical protein GOP47_0005587 [Adiantum capillus-veneris]|uniref:Uncharacterized protein n=1 Tax=Adiantum capillus-veneris TaxID=13818 RepID=A0A9D4ZLI7_ADICA|nr:hypothetical protein GOP47_0005587 [Adiantum capillus-veneris]
MLRQGEANGSQSHAPFSWNVCGRRSSCLLSRRRKTFFGGSVVQMLVRFCFFRGSWDSRTGDNFHSGIAGQVLKGWALLKPGSELLGRLVNVGLLHWLVHHQI